MVYIFFSHHDVTPPNSNNTTLICGNSNGLNYVTGNSSDVNRYINTTNVNLAIGSTDIISRAFKGKIANVLIYNRELTSTEMQENADYLAAKWYYPHNTWASTSYTWANIPSTWNDA